MPPLLKGLAIGFSIAAPVGPIGLLCIRRSMNEGRWIGFISGLGAASADAIYGTVAALGLTAITELLVAQRLWLGLVGGAFLVYLGIATMRTAPSTGEATAPAPTTRGAAYASTFALTLTNPMTILSFAGIFAGIGLTAGDSPWDGVCLVGGVAAGSAAWWLILSATASWLGARLKRGGLRLVNGIAGLVLLGFGVWQLAVVVRSLR